MDQPEDLPLSQSQIKAALNMGRQGTARRDNCDAVLIKGGNIRGERDYDQYNFTLEGLRTEMQEEEPVLVYLVSGKALRKCMKETWHGPNPGWMQV